MNRQAGAVLVVAVLAVAVSGVRAAESADVAAQRAALEALARSRPVGPNCALTQAPDEAGETGGHGVVVRVYPRRGDMSTRYTGCQTVFSQAAGLPDRLVWLVEIVQGEPVRLWTTDPLMQGLLACRYRGGVLTRGEPRVCPPASELLMPSQPAGCLTSPGRTAGCEFDGR